MTRMLLALSLLVLGCNDRHLGVGSDLAPADAAAATDLASPDLASALDLGSCRADKLKFTDCKNDGSVEFCASTALAATLGTISTTLSCQPGGGRAGCNRTGVVLCTYPTTVPRECVASHGALTAAAFADLCAFAAYDEVVEIVPTLYD